MKWSKHFRVKPGQAVRLADWDATWTGSFKDKDDARDGLRENIARMDELQYLLYAQRKYALLIVLQGMDASGKDGTIRHVMSGLNPQSCYVQAFKEPTPEELDHDFLWRIHHAVPGRGEIGIFNRSHYEDVLVVRVHDLVPRRVWGQRYDQIKAFERILTENNVVILKFFLNTSRDEQRVRLQDRLKDPTKRWKISPADFAERKYWSAYQQAYEEALTKCNAAHAPWFVIPADHRWFRNWAVSQIIVEALEGLKMKFPRPKFNAAHIRIP
ncbi:MAG: polyphosphate kinase 2 family protein [Verrucomicrobia bacterium]|nr:MAG: polyphosphate kinase 2 family protein [Verrucomicrobiota bacterium]